jgi:hypothetical protein
MPRPTRTLIVLVISLCVLLISVIIAPPFFALLKGFVLSLTSSKYGSPRHTVTRHPDDPTLFSSEEPPVVTEYFDQTLYKTIIENPETTLKPVATPSEIAPVVQEPSDNEMDHDGYKAVAYFVNWVSVDFC